MTNSNQDSHSSHQQRVKIVENGPYLVSGGLPLSEQTIATDADGQCHGWEEGKKYSPGRNYSLCRCGQSKAAPFCDGTHSKIQFDGTEQVQPGSYLEQATVLEGPGLTLTDVEDFCADARFCQRAGGIWELTRRSDDAAARDCAIEEACDCPSGRLTVWDRDGNPIEPYFEPSIVLVQDDPAGKTGPIWVRGGVPVESAEGNTYEVRNRVTLCRCGRSSKKPFCDGSHLK